MKYWLTVYVLAAALQPRAQDSTRSSRSVILSGYAEVYYSYDFSRPSGNSRPAFLYSHNRHNECSVNLAFLKASYATGNVRTCLALGTGSYMAANYTGERGIWQQVYEASVGAKLSRNHHLWIDVGVFPSHIGAESAVSLDCPTLTRSIMAEQSPYFESGARLEYVSRNEQWVVTVLALNGWQRIQRVDGNSLMSGGIALQYQPSHRLTLHYNNFLGAGQPDSLRLWRFFHNLYGVWSFHDQLILTAGVDIGQQQAVNGSGDYNTWYGASGTLRYVAGPKWAFAMRGEYYRDAHQVMVSMPAADGSGIWGCSGNVDRVIAANCSWRTEIRLLKSRGNVFTDAHKQMTNRNTAVTTSLAIRF